MSFWRELLGARGNRSGLPDGGPAVVTPGLVSRVPRPKRGREYLPDESPLQTTAKPGNTDATFNATGVSGNLFTIPARAGFRFWLRHVSYRTSTSQVTLRILSQGNPVGSNNDYILQRTVSGSTANNEYWPEPGLPLKPNREYLVTVSNTVVALTVSGYWEYVG